MRSVIAGVLFAIVTAAYFAPTMIARRRMKQEAARIFLVNLLLGWTVTGWLAALTWAASSREGDSRTAEHAKRWRRAVRHSQRARPFRC